MIAAVAARRLLVALRLPLEVGAGYVVEQELEVHPEPALVPLHQVLAQPVLVRPHLVQSPVQPVVVDRIGGDAGDVLQRRARVPRLGDAQLGGLAAELAHGQHGGDVGPRHLLPAGLDQGVQELMQAQASPEGQPEEHGPELAHAADLDAAEVGQFPGTGLGQGLRGPVGKFRLTRPGLAAIQERLDLVPAGAEVVVVELAQRRDDPLPRAALGADGLAERPVLVGLTIDASAVLAEEHALVFRAGRRVPRGCSPLHEPFDLRRPPFPGIPKNSPQRIRGRFRPAAELGLAHRRRLCYSRFPATLDAGFTRFVGSQRDGPVMAVKVTPCLGGPEFDIPGEFP